MAKAVSVDQLCGFGAKLFQRCARFMQDGREVKSDDPASAGHFPGVKSATVSRLVRLSEECPMLGRPWA
jgi:hypothetical protein